MSEQPGAYKYKAFISYSHKADNKTASALESALRSFARPNYLSPAMSVFRDKTELSANPALWTAIQTALSESEYFILLASPLSAESRWVKREIDYWLRLHHGKTNHIFIVWTDGKLPWGEVFGETHWERATALPARLDWDAANDSPVDLKTVFTEEPLFLDFRELKESPDLTLGNERFLDEIANLAAPLHGKRKSVLIGEDAARQRKYKRIRRGLVTLLSVLLLLTTGAALYANQQRINARESQKQAEAALAGEKSAREEAQRRREEAEEALHRENLAKQEAQDRRRDAEEALRGETIAKKDAEEKRIEADKQRQRAEEQTKIAEQRRKEAEEQTEIALSRQLTAQSELIPLQHPSLLERGTLLGIESLQRLPSVEADQAVRRQSALLGHPVSLFQRREDSQLIVGFSFNPRGTYVITSDQNVATVWDAKNGQQVMAVSHTDDAENDGEQPSDWQPYDSKIRDVAVSPDGTQLVTASEDQTARIWDVATGRELWRLNHSKPGSESSKDVERVIFSDKGNLIATQSWGSAYVWDRASGRKLMEAESVERINGMGFTADERFLITISRSSMPMNKDDGSLTVQVWDITSGSEVARMVHEAGESYNDFAFAISQGGKYVATYNKDRSIRIWEVAGGRERGRLKPAYKIGGIEFSPDGDSLAAICEDNTARVWDIASGRELARMKHAERIASIFFTPDGKNMITSGDDKTTRVWNAETGEELLRIPRQYLASGFVVSADSKFIATTDAQTVYVWDISPQPRTFAVSSEGSVDASAFSADGRSYAMASNKSVHVWETLKGNKLASFELKNVVGLLVLSPDSRYLAGVSGSDRVISLDSGEAVGGRGDTVFVWDVKNQKEVLHRTFPSNIYSLTFSPKEFYLGVALQGSVEVVDVLENKVIANMPHRDEAPDGRPQSSGTSYNPVGALSFSPDGQYLVTVDNGWLTRIWDVKTGNLIKRIMHNTMTRIVGFSHDERYLFTVAQDSNFKVWELATGKEIASLPEAGMTNSSGVSLSEVALSGDGKLIATKSKKEEVWIREVATGRTTFRLAHGSGIDLIRFSPSGNYLATTTNNLLRVWDVKTGKEIARKVYDSSPGGENQFEQKTISEVLFSADDKVLIVVSHGFNEANMLSTWGWQSQDLITDVCSRLTRNLTREEWSQYFADRTYHKTCSNLPDPPAPAHP